MFVDYFFAMCRWTLYLDAVSLTDSTLHGLGRPVVSPANDDVLAGKRLHVLDVGIGAPALDGDDLGIVRIRCAGLVQGDIQGSFKLAINFNENTCIFLKNPW